MVVTFINQLKLITCGISRDMFVHTDRHTYRNVTLLYRSFVQAKEKLNNSIVITLSGTYLRFSLSHT